MVALSFQREKRKLKNLATVGIYLSPPLIIVSVFTYFAFIYCVYLSFFDWNLLSAKRFVGIDNYTNALGSADFWNSIKVTFIYVLGAVPPCIILGMAVGLILNWITKAKGFFRLMFFLPFIVSMVVASTVWKLLLNPGNLGLVNHILFALHIKPSHWTNWVNDPQGGAMASVIIVGIWKFIGYNGVLFLAGLKNISPVFYEAATIDGANPLQKFLNITLPLLSPTTFIVAMLQLISAFKVVESIMLMTEGGPANSTMALVLYIYNNAFSYFKIGYASTLSVILFVIIMIFTVIQLSLEKKLVHYQ